MGKTVPNAFSLIELLVVIAIMAIIGAYTLANYRPFGEDQSLKSAVLDIQSLLKQAQTNATTNAICNTGSSALWQVAFSADGKTLNPDCQESSVSYARKPLQLGANIAIQSAVTGTGSDCPAALPFTVNFSLLKGDINFGGANCTSLKITLKNNKTGRTKDLTIEQGGRIYGQ